MTDKVRLKVMQPEQAHDYLRERPVWPHFYAGSTAVEQIVAFEDDGLVTLMEHNKRREQFKKFEVTYGLQYCGVEQRGRYLPRWRPAYGLEPADAIEGQRLILRPNYRSGEPFPTAPLTEIRPGAQHIIDGFTDKERQAAFELLWQQLVDMRLPE
jgi:hypothetical protein